MKNITVTTQAELDALPDSFVEYTQINIKASARVVISKRWGNASAILRNNASAILWDNASAILRDNASAILRDNASAILRDNAVLWLFSYAKAILNGWSVAFKLSAYATIEVQSKNAIVQDRSDGKQEPYLEREGVEQKDGSVVLFKKVSSDFKTQEKTDHKTCWPIGATVTHPNWNPNGSECGAGKFHACSRPYFCDEFRNEQGDKYIAIQIKVTDLYEWPGRPGYPHKIAFREGIVLGECNKLGKMKES